MSYDSRRRRKEQHDRLPPFVPLLLNTIDSAAWRATSHGAKALYIVLRRRYSPKRHNNGSIFVSERVAKRELRSDREQIRRWFRELQHYGFIVQIKAGSLGVEGKGKAPHWKLTELGCRKLDGTLEPPTRDFERWNGSKFRESRKQNPGREIPSRVDGKSPPVADGKSRPLRGPSGRGNPSISEPKGGREIPSIPRVTTSAQPARASGAAQQAERASERGARTEPEPSRNA
jgi:hypothetical protein